MRNTVLKRLHKIFKSANYTDPKKNARETIAELEPILIAKFDKFTSEEIYDPFDFCSDVQYSKLYEFYDSVLKVSSDNKVSVIFKFDVGGAILYHVIEINL